MANTTGYGYLLGPAPQFFDANGKTLVGGKLFVYIAGTTTKAVTYSDFYKTENTNPVVLNDFGTCMLIVPSENLYKIVLYDRNGNLLLTRDNVRVSSGPKVESSDSTVDVTETTDTDTGIVTYDLSIQKEIDRATGAEKGLTDAIDAEKKRAESAESALSKSIADETKRATEAEKGLADAIEALDVSSVGGDGKYISAISETDGKISATATTMDATPTENSTKAVTSGGIKTALNDKFDKYGFFGNTDGKWIGAALSVVGETEVKYWKLCSFTTGKFWTLNFVADVTNARYDFNVFERKIIAIYGSTPGGVTEALEIREGNNKLYSTRGYGNIIYYETSGNNVTIYIKARFASNVSQFCRLVSVLTESSISNLTWYQETTAGTQPENPVKFSLGYKTVKPAGSTSVPVYIGSDGNPTACTDDFVHNGDVTSTYSSTGTAPVNGKAVAAAINALDVDSKVDKVANATSGNFAGLDKNGNLTDSGKKASDFATSEQGGKADSAIQGVKLNGASSALTHDSNNVVTIPDAVATGTTGATNGLMTSDDKKKLNGIASGTASPLMDGNASVGNSLKYAREDHVHPSDTSREDIENKTTVVLGTSDSKYPTDKAVAEFVNSSIATNTANYISNNGEPFTSVEQLKAYSGPVTNNDYASVTGIDSEGNTYYDRYKATVSGSTVTWALEYRLNNSSFTSAQWSAINSGITSALVAKIHKHSNKDVLDGITSDKVNYWDGKEDAFDVLPTTKGGTGTNAASKSELTSSLINSLSTGSSTPGDADYYVSQYANGGNTTTSYHRRPVSALWNYIKGKISSVLKLTASDYAGKAATAGTADKAVADKSGNDIETTYATKSELSTHTRDTTVHITAEERNAWNEKASTSVATTSANGLMSKTDKSKLDGISSGANKSDVSYASAKLIKTIDGTSSDVFAASEIINDTNTFGNFAAVTDVNVGGTIYHTYWKVAPTSSNQVFGFAVHPSTGILFRIENNKGKYSDYRYDTDTTYTFDGTYNSSTNKAATVSSVTTRIAAAKEELTGAIDTVDAKGIVIKEINGENVICFE